MTIKELESRTGMTRASIRFYEGEGLLSPKRLDNGYRDYSEEDVRTLEKIKLLRQLQLDIDTIRKVQGGALTLEQALFTQLTKLEGDKAVLERAAQVCRELQQTSVEYAALEPRTWLRQLEAPRRQELPEPPAGMVTEAEWDWEPRACYCPWQRYFARTLDVLLCDTVINVLWLVLFHDLSLWRFQANSIGGLLFGLAVLVLVLAVEPLWLHFVGWTPGKFLFGLKLRDEDGGRLTLARAWERSWRVFQDGYGWYVPFWNLWKMWQCRKLGLDGRDCWWDAEEDYRYTKVERRFSVGVAYVVIALALLGGQTAARRWAELPINRGDLTVAEFCQNYNQYHKQYFDSLDVVSEPKLDQEGHWVELESGNAVTIRGESTVIMTGTDGSTIVIENAVEDSAVWDQLDFTLKDGRVAAVALRMRTQDSVVWPDTNRDRLCLLALSGAVGGVNLFSFDWRDWLTKPWNEVELAWESTEFDWKGLHVSRKVEYAGYEPDAALVSTEEDGPRHCEITTTISLIE